MNKDGVSTGFGLITDELKRFADDIADQGSRAFKEGRYDDAQRLSGTGKNLHSFIEKINNLLGEWQAGFDLKKRSRSHTDKNHEIRHHTKSHKTRLRVRFNNGKEIIERYAADTFALAIKEIGFDKIEALGLSAQGLPLVGSKRSNERNQRHIDGKYICVHSSTNRKKEILETIAGRLGLGLKVEIIQ
jgi:hypothetical protein